MSTIVMLKSKSESENFLSELNKIIPTKLESKLKTVSSELNFKVTPMFTIYSTVALVPPMSTMYVWRGIT